MMEAVRHTARQYTCARPNRPPADFDIDAIGSGDEPRDASAGLEARTHLDGPASQRTIKGRPVDDENLFAGRRLPAHLVKAVVTNAKPGAVQASEDQIFIDLGELGRFSRNDPRAMNRFARRLVFLEDVDVEPTLRTSLRSKKTCRASSDDGHVKHCLL